MRWRGLGQATIALWHVAAYYPKPTAYMVTTAINPISGIVYHDTIPACLRQPINGNIGGTVERFGSRGRLVPSKHGTVG